MFALNWLPIINQSCAFYNLHAVFTLHGGFQPGMKFQPGKPG